MRKWILTPLLWAGLGQGARRRWLCLVFAFAVGVWPDFARADDHAAPEGGAPPRFQGMDTTMMELNCEDTIPLLSALKNLLDDDSAIVTGSLFSDVGLRTLFGETSVTFIHNKDDLKIG